MITDSLILNNSKSIMVNKYILKDKEITNFFNKVNKEKKSKKKIIFSNNHDDIQTLVDCKDSDDIDDDHEEDIATQHLYTSYIFNHKDMGLSGQDLVKLLGEHEKEMFLIKIENQSNTNKFIFNNEKKSKNKIIFSNNYNDIYTLVVCKDSDDHKEDIKNQHLYSSNIFNIKDMGLSERDLVELLGEHECFSVEIENQSTANKSYILNKRKKFEDISNSTLQKKQSKDDFLVQMNIFYKDEILKFLGELKKKEFQNDYIDYNLLPSSINIEDINILKDKIGIKYFNFADALSNVHTAQDELEDLLDVPTIDPTDHSKFRIQFEASSNDDHEDIQYQRPYCSFNNKDEIVSVSNDQSCLISTFQDEDKKINSTQKVIFVANNNDIPAFLDDKDNNEGEIIKDTDFRNFINENKVLNKNNYTSQSTKKMKSRKKVILYDDNIFIPPFIIYLDFNSVRGALKEDANKEFIDEEETVYAA